jgi:DNA polymerase III epsilon subunit-like protein
MHYNLKQRYVPALHLHEFNERSLIIDTETIGIGPSIEIIEVALCDYEGQIVYESLIRPVYNALPPPSKHQRFDRAEILKAPYWADIYPAFSSLVNGLLLIAYNAGFDQRAVAAERSRYQQVSTERGWRCAMPPVKSKIGTKKSVTLTDACAYFGLAGGNHRAACDAQATYQLLKRLQDSSG